MKFKRLITATLFDVVEQRELEAADFRIVLNYKTVKGRRMLVRSDNFGIILTLELEIYSEYFRLRICGGSLVEEQSIRYRTMKIRLIPDFLDTKVGEQGSYMLPLWSGVLVDFRNRPHCVNCDRIYMEQREWEKFTLMNCFGFFHDSGNILGIVETGDFRCDIISEFNRDSINSLCASFIMREDPSDMVDIHDCTVAYHQFPADTEYDDLAMCYREYLLSRGATLLADRIEENDVLRYSASAMRVKIFMATKQPHVPDGSSPVVVQTSCDEACLIIDAMKKAGIEQAVITLVGWNLGGHDGAYPTHFPVEPAIGGESGLRKLIDYAKAAGYQIVPHDNVTDSYRGSPDFDYEYVARMKSGEPVVVGLWGGGQSYKMCPRVFLQRYGSEFERVRELGFEGHYYLDAQSTVLWSCSSKLHPANPEEFAMTLAALTEVPRSIYGAVSVECPAVYTIPYIDECASVKTLFAKLPLNLSERLSPYSIPFYEIALHGLILYQRSFVNTYSDPETELLREIAFGARPSMEVCYHKNGGNGGLYQPNIDKVKNAYDLCFNQFKIQNCTFKSFKEPSRGIYEAIYSNGLHLVVNTTAESWRDIPAKSWKKY